MRFPKEMTLRDYFAAHAISGTLSQRADWSWAASDVADLAYEIADRMLEQRQPKYSVARELESERQA